MDVIRPDWPAKVGALVTTASMGDMAGGPGRARLRLLVPSEPRWLHQVHGARVIDADTTATVVQADAAVAREPGTVCVVKIADCMPVLFTDQSGSVVAAAHAGWRGLAGGVLEATVEAMRAPGAIHAWLGPAIGAGVYEVGDEVRSAIGGPDSAFRATRPGHWLLDLYAVARARLKNVGVQHIHGGGFCTYTERDRFFSYRRDHGQSRMAAAIWLT
jgi:YfiH family protein